jgi:malonyl-CoA decarboxylase
MNTPGWISRSVSRWIPGTDGGRNVPSSPANHVQAAIKTGANLESKGVKQGAKPVARTTHERLLATLRQGDEALSPRMLRRTLDELRAIIDSRISEVEGGRRAQGIAAWYRGATLERRRDLWLLMSEQFTADAAKVKAAQAKFDAAVGTAEEAVAEVNYRRATVSPRRRLLQRFSVNADGIAFLIAIRAEFQTFLKADRRLMALDVEMEYMFSTWFDVGFLELQRISWDSPASLIEKLIEYEAVHDIKSWADVKNRLDSDRRCYGFFHPRLPGVPLIFVEVALADAIASDIMPLLDETAAPTDLKAATTAIFYSISNTQTGLRGVSFGDSLIKRVVEALKLEFPQLNTFVTLSPIPGFRAWLQKNAAATLERLDAKQLVELGRAVGFEPPGPLHFLEAADRALTLPESSPVRRVLMAAGAQYLARGMEGDKPLDPVARFHLGNGARIERLNWAADPSAKGFRQSYGLMVNYLYDLKRLDKNRAQLANGDVPVSGALRSLLSQ